jgi:hypothetical protein
MWFWYRQSPRYLVPANHVGWVNANDPPSVVTGMIDVRLDAEGRLLRFQAVPPDAEATSAPVAEPDWPALFALAGPVDAEQQRPDLVVAARPIELLANPGDRVVLGGSEQPRVGRLLDDHPVDLEQQDLRPRLAVDHRLLERPRHSPELHLDAGAEQRGQARGRGERSPAGRESDQDGECARHRLSGPPAQLHPLVLPQLGHL